MTLAPAGLLPRCGRRSHDELADRLQARGLEDACIAVGAISDKLRIAGVDDAEETRVRELPGERVLPMSMR